MMDAGIWVLVALIVVKILCFGSAAGCYREARRCRSQREQTEWLFWALLAAMVVLR